ncbi:unnamed protein product [Allacma fusca]|uniref:Uncharacterized protein n=1 Tax=Allacma fusca TaxID=39272 RepID=A0A8J2LHK1_9HEXA|nr:unnamed protein product [Allacma fusca]
MLDQINPHDFPNLALFLRATSAINMKRQEFQKILTVLVVTCFCILVALQYFSHETTISVIIQKFAMKQNATFASNQEIDEVGSLPSEENCVPHDLRYLTTKYSAKLCHPKYLWAKNYSSLVQLTCKYPALNPFDNVITKFMGQSVKRNLCVKDSTLPKMFSTDYASNLLTLQSPETFGFFNCCYRVLTPRKDSDFSAARPSKICFPIDSLSQRIRDEFIKIVCYDGNNSDANGTVQNEIVVDFQAFVKPELKIPNIIPRLDLQYTVNLDTQLNVAILGLDAISHMNLIRTMPKSYEYIQETLNAFGFFGYNSIADNTINNMIPLLTGNFQAAVTRPFLVKMRHSLALSITPKGASKNIPRTFTCDLSCKLPIISNRYFQLLWESPLSHSFLNRPVAGDDIFLEALTWFKQNNYLNNTVLILMSDHGMRRSIQKPL